MPVPPKVINIIDVVAAYQTIVDYLKNRMDKKPSVTKNFEGTAERAARALDEMCWEQWRRENEVDRALSVEFPIDHQEDVEPDKPKNSFEVQGPISVNFICPHHLLPVNAEIYVSYIPIPGRVLGLSKLSRVCVALSKRPVLQEQLATDIADTLYKSKYRFESIGSAVQIIGLHNCMVCRGIEQSAVTASTVLRGIFWEKTFEERFFQLISIVRNSYLNRNRG